MSLSLAESMGRLFLGLHGLGWALVYAAVIGCVVGVGAWVALSLLDRRNAWVRYVVSGGAILFVLGSIPFAGSSILSAYGDHDERVAVFASSLMAGGAPDASGTLPGGWTAAALDRAVRALHDHEVPPWIDGETAASLGGLLALFAALWLFGAARGLVRLGVALRDVESLRRRATHPVSGRWESALREGVREFGVRRRVTLRVSPEIDGPMVIGGWAPTILLPPRAHETLTGEEARAVIAHELAHVRRGDYVVNLLQMVAEALLFFHPVIHWLGDRLRDEREFCSDALALRSIGGSVTGYLRALETLEGQRVTHAPRLALPAVGRSLLARTERLVRQEIESGPRRRDADVLTVLVVLLALWVPVLVIGRHAHHASVALMKHELMLPRDYERIARDGGVVLAADGIGHAAEGAD